MIPMAKIKLSKAGYPTPKPRPNRTTPRITAKIVRRMMNLLISFFNGESYVLALAAKLAI